MNLRILKKLSKRAVPYLAPLGFRDEPFRAPKNDCHCDTLIRDRACFDRQIVADHATAWHGGYLYRTRAGRLCSVRPPSCVLQGTWMIGHVSGCDGDWWETDAFSAVADVALCQTFGFSEDGQLIRSEPRLTARRIFEILDGLVAKKGECLMFDTLEELGARNAAMDLGRWLDRNKHAYKIEESITPFAEAADSFVKERCAFYGTRPALVWAAHALLIRV